MPFTAGEIATAGKSGLDFYLKNNPIDQVQEDYPLLRDLSAKKKSFPGAKENVVEQLRIKYDSNFQFFRGDSAVTYNNRDSLDQAKYPWYSAHDGLSLTEDRLAQNGIFIHEGTPGKATKAELIQLNNLFQEQMEILDLGMKESFHKALWLDGSGGADNIVGVDHLVSLDPTTGVVGGIDRATAANAFWRNNVATSLTSANIIASLEEEWKNCIRYGGGKPTKIYAGWDFIQAFRAAAKGEIDRFKRVDTGRATLDPATDLQFMGVPITWVPQFDDNFGGDVSPLTHWSKRCYMINENAIKLRPMDKQDFVSRKPPRSKDAYVHYWAITWRGSLTMNNSRSNAVLALS